MKASATTITFGLLAMFAVVTLARSSSSDPNLTAEVLALRAEVEQLRLKVDFLMQNRGGQSPLAIPVPQPQSAPERPLSHVYPTLPPKDAKSGRTIEGFNPHQHMMQQFEEGHSLKPSPQ